MSLKDLNPVNADRAKRIAIVLSNPARSPTTGWPVGFWWSELSIPTWPLPKRATRLRFSRPMAENARPTP
jgi:hypothetical protein